MQIRDPVPERSGLVYGVAATRLEVRCTFTYRQISSGPVVGAYPVGFGHRGQHWLFGWVERFAPCLGAVTAPRDEHHRGRAFGAALHVHLAYPTDIDQTSEVLVLAGVALT